MALKPWYDVVKPREDLCQGKPLDAAEFAVHLDQIRDGRAPDVYCNPSLFFERTYLTKTLTSLAGEVVRRLSGEITETSAVFNMTTQFGGGKTHGLTLLYHLARSGNKAKRFYGVQNILEKAGVPSIPEAAVAVFVGTEFDAVKGRGGEDGTPHRQTPWGEIAYQIGGEKTFSLVANHDKERVEPKGDVIRKMIPEDRPCLILMDEMLSYFSTYRRQGYSTSLYNFIQALSETVRGSKNAVLVASLPASEIEYNPEDQGDEDRLKKMLDRVGKPIMMSAEAETAEIIRRRLFDWDESERDLSGRIHLNRDAIKTCDAYADWIRDHRQQIPQWFANDDPLNQFRTTYPFHPSVLSVFERKWQSLPRFQRTRGVLRLLAQWVSKNYEEGTKRNHKNPLIHMGSAPLSDSIFRTAIMEQVGSDRIEAPLMTDIAGGERAHAWKLDKEAVDSIRKTKLHVGTATSIFFESTGGGTRESASLPELRLALGSPEVDIGNIETVLEGLSNDCYYLISENNQYRFSLKPNLNKLLSDRISDVKDDAIRELVRSYVQKGFVAHGGVYIHPFPSKTNPIPDRPQLTFVVLAPDQLEDDPKLTLKTVEDMTREHGNSARTYKSSLIWCVPDSSVTLNEEAKKSIAWEDIRDNDAERLDENQISQLQKNIKEAPGNIREAVWKSYRKLYYLDRDNKIKEEDLGFLHSSSAKSITEYLLQKLEQEDLAVKRVNPRFLERNWPPAFEAWSTKQVHDAFFASPKFPRLLNAEGIKETISDGVTEGIFAYVGKDAEGRYRSIHFEEPIQPHEVEISEDMFLIKAEVAKKHIEPPTLTTLRVSPTDITLEPEKIFHFTASGFDQHGQSIEIGQPIEWSVDGGEIDSSGSFAAKSTEGVFTITASCGGVLGKAHVTIQQKGEEGETPAPSPLGGPRKLIWTGDVPPRKWTNFYSKVLSKHSSNPENLTLKVTFEILSEEGFSEQKVEETRQALRELGLEDDVRCS